MGEDAFAQTMSSRHILPTRLLAEPQCRKRLIQQVRNLWGARTATGESGGASGAC